MFGTELEQEKLSRFGYKFDNGGVHLARTMMIDDLESLFDLSPDTALTKDQYFSAIIDDNCLGKPSLRTRQLSARHLADLYGLDSSVPIFRGLLYLWKRDEAARPLLALLCAYARDSLLRKTASKIMELPTGTLIVREDMEKHIATLFPGRYSEAMLRSAAQNINGTWTRSGHLQGISPKKRVQPELTKGAAAYALFLGYLVGARGRLLFETDYFKLLDCDYCQGMQLAEDASKAGWIVFKRIGDVMEALFPLFLTEEEMRWLDE